MMKQYTSIVLMIQPTKFGFNAEAAATNSFQQNPIGTDPAEIQAKALKEFNGFVDQLTEIGIDVILYEDDKDSITPDSIFPNNWFSTHATGELVLYPMAVKNRRFERKSEIVHYLKNRFDYTIIDLTAYELKNPPQFLEGTGSMILDRINRNVYAALSPRTNRTVLNDFCEQLKYSPICFNAFGKEGELIYHTNVMMFKGANYSVIGYDTISVDNLAEVKSALQNGDEQIIELSNEQVYDHFAGNMLQLINKDQETVLVMSQKAYDSLNDNQLSMLNNLNDHLLIVSIPTIEAIGGGSVRCMLAEIFPPN